MYHVREHTSDICMSTYLLRFTDLMLYSTQYNRIIYYHIILTCKLYYTTIIQAVDTGGVLEGLLLHPYNMESL